MTVNPTKPSFSLVNHDGRPVSQADFNGKITIVFFGFTHCRKVCPDALSRLSKVLDRLGEAAANVNPLYISVDPERDTPEVMKTFLSSHAPRFTGLTGTEDQVKAARKVFHVFAQRKEDKNDPEGYVIPHTAITYILGPDGTLLDHLNDGLDVQEVTDRIRKSVEQYFPQVSPHKNGHNTSNGQLNTPGNESLNRLDKNQIASVRHIGNLARQLKGDWSHMMGNTDLHDGFGAYRFQLAFASYALALTHFHRLPAAPGVFKPTLKRLIEKMCHTDVWFYWRDASRGGGVGNTPRKPGAMDPIAVDNIMYSAYLQSITALYTSLFNDDHYTKPGSITLSHNPFFWGDGPFKFEYDSKTINDLIYWQMVENGYIGVACEPGCIFQNCNQPPILGFRLNDELYGTKRADEVTAGYEKAWEKYGSSIDENGAVRFYLIEHNQVVVPSISPGMDSWCCLLMHAWRPKFIEDVYEDQKPKWLKRHDDGSVSVNVRSLHIKGDGVNDLLLSSEHGWVAALAAEMGDKETLDGLLKFADDYHSPYIQNGGLIYPRHDTIWNEDGNYVMSSPMQANALYPLARLNVRDGFRKLYEHPWGPNNSQQYENPALTDVDFSIDVYRAVYDSAKRTLLFDVAAFKEGAKGSVVISRVFDRGDWTLLLEQEEVAWGDSSRLKDSKAEVQIEQVGQTLSLLVSSTEVVSFQLIWH